MNDGVRVAVLGAGGTIAPAIVRDLGESDEVRELVLLDIDRDRAGRVAAAHGCGKARAARADATDGSLASALDGCRALVNAASYRVNLAAMDACLAAGVHYLDLGGLYWMTERQLARSEEFERAGLLALLGIGSAPGKTNLMAAWAVGELNATHTSAGRADGDLTIAVSAAGRDLAPPRRFSVPYSLRTLLDELTMNPVVLRDGRAVELEPLSEGGAVDFGEPIGEADTIYTLHSELRTFGDSFGCREASFRLSLAPAVLERVRALIDAPEEEVAHIAKEALPPSQKTVAVHLIEAEAAGRRARVRSFTRPAEDWGIGGGVVSTAAPAAAAARLLACGRIEARGALPPERCLDRGELVAELERRGTEFEVKVEEVAAA
jgi:lysine 6-dehydrogenase